MPSRHIIMMHFGVIKSSFLSKSLVTRPFAREGNHQKKIQNAFQWSLKWAQPVLCDFKSILISDTFENITAYNFNIKSVALEDKHESLLIFRLLFYSTLLECMASCYFNYGLECKFLVYDQPNCYLGNPLIKNGSFKAPNGTIFYYERG